VKLTYSILRIFEYIKREKFIALSMAVFFITVIIVTPRLVSKTDEDEYFPVIARPTGDSMDEIRREYSLAPEETSEESAPDKTTSATRQSYELKSSSSQTRTSLSSRTSESSDSSSRSISRSRFDYPETVWLPADEFISERDNEYVVKAEYPVTATVRVYDGEVLLSEVEVISAIFITVFMGQRLCVSDGVYANADDVHPFDLPYEREMFKAGFDLRHGPLMVISPEYPVRLVVYTMSTFTDDAIRDIYYVNENDRIVIYRGDYIYTDRTFSVVQ